MLSSGIGDSQNQFVHVVGMGGGVGVGHHGADVMADQADADRWPISTSRR